MAFKIKVTLEGFPQVWETGREILDASVTLGQQEKSSSCQVTIADPTGSIAAAMIKHTLAAGGIAALPGGSGTTSGVAGTTADGTQLVTVQPGNYQKQGTSSNGEVIWSNAPKSDAEWEQSIVRECLRQGVTDKGQIAYILATAKGESSMGRDMVENASGSAYEGRRDLGNTSPGDGVKYRGRGLVQITGKGNYQRFSKLTGTDLVADPDQATRPDIALFTMVYGMKNGTITGAKLGTYVNGEKRDFYNARRTVNGIRADQVGKYQAWANEYYSQIDRLMSTAKQTPLNPAPINKTTIEPNKTEDKQTSQPANSTAQDPLATSEVYKGSKLTVSAEGYNWEFYHQGTETDDQGMTKINGQGIRWVLSRRDRNKTEKSLSLKQLAEKIAKAHGAKLEWLADFDPQYTFIDQTGISDYALLKREAEQNGLFVSEQNLVITIKSLRNIQDKQIVISPGSNLIGYVIQDLALDKLKDDQSSSLVQQDAKVELDILTGQFKQVKPEVDPAKDKASTGKKQEEATGTLAPGQDAIASQQKGRVKRVQGLPSRFTVVSDQAVLGLQPLDAVRTTGLPGVLSRIWLVDSVTHNLGDGTTDINCYSPIEVIGADVPSLSGGSAGNMPGNAQTTGATQTLNAPKGFQFPVTGYSVTDTRHLRSRHPVTGQTKFHHGTDIGTPMNTPVHASADGVVKFSGVQSGYGNIIIIEHSNGWTTRYAHLNSLGARVGQPITRGQQIGLSGNTGIGTGAHLHWEVRDPSGNSVDPSTVGLPASKGQKI